MHALFRKIILVGLVIIGFSSCNQEQKTDKPVETQEFEPTASLSKSRYNLGDSVAIHFDQPVAKLDIQMVGLDLLIKTASDSTVIVPKKANVGWQQLVVRGVRKDNSSFADTIRIELLSDVVPTEIIYTKQATYPHLKSSFTEGLEFYKNELYEGTGENGKSQLLKLDLNTGKALKSVNLDQKYFGEGITIVHDKIYQLTWQSGVCFRYNMDFSLDKTFNYYFQGWGLTHNDTTLMMSDGSNKIHFFNTEFEKTGDLQVYDNNGPVTKLNELEYVNGFIYANVFESTRIVKIDATTGKVVAFMNMDKIVPAEVDVRKDVLNGIAFNPEDKLLYVTGKNWPVMYSVKIKDTTIF